MAKTRKGETARGSAMQNCVVSSAVSSFKGKRVHLATFVQSVESVQGSYASIFLAVQVAL